VTIAHSAAYFLLLSPLSPKSRTFSSKIATITLLEAQEDRALHASRTLTKTQCSLTFQFIVYDILSLWFWSVSFSFYSDFMQNTLDTLGELLNYSVFISRFRYADIRELIIFHSFTRRYTGEVTRLCYQEITWETSCAPMNIPLLHSLQISIVKAEKSLGNCRIFILLFLLFRSGLHIFTIHFSIASGKSFKLNINIKNDVSI